MCADPQLYYAAGVDLQSKDISEIAQKLAESPKKSSKARLVVITQGAESTIVASSENKQAKVFPVSALPSEAIVDTNGAGDAFAGGFLGATSAGKSLDDAIEVGHRLGQQCVQLSGPTFKFPKEKIMD